MAKITDLFGCVNNPVKQKLYTGIDTETAKTTVDNIHNTIKVDVTPDDALSIESENTVKNKTIAQAISKLNGYYTNIEKLEDYAYSITYDDIDYDFGYKYFKQFDTPTEISSCSAFRIENAFVRNYDLIYNELASFIVKTPATANRYAVMGTAGTISELTKSFVESNEFSETYKAVPFKLLDGKNEFGLIACMNVVPTDKGKNEKVIPTEESKVEICTSMLIRYILDYFTNATDAVQFIQKHMTIYHPKYLHDADYEIHYLISDKDDDYIVEFINNRTVIINCKEKHIFPIITNFLISDVQFNDDGSVYTPATQDSNHNAIITNKITPHGSGLERYNYIVDILNNWMPSIDDYPYILQELKYTNTYTRDPDEWPLSFWYTDYVDSTHTVITPPQDFTDTINEWKLKYENRSRNPQSANYGTWQTVHSIIYQLDTFDNYVAFQENFDYSIDSFYKFTLSSLNAYLTKNEFTEARNSYVKQGLLTNTFNASEQNTVKQKLNIIDPPEQILERGTEEYSFQSISSTGLKRAKGKNSIALGENARADTTNAVAIGYNAHASGNGSMALSYGDARGTDSLSWGHLSYAMGPGSVSFGGQAQCYNSVTFISGMAERDPSIGQTKGAEYGFAVGQDVHVKNYGEIGLGFRNNSHRGISEESPSFSSENTMFSIGIGDSNKRNALEIMQNGDMYIKGIGGYEGTESLPINKDTLQTVLSNIQSSIIIRKFTNADLQYGGNIYNLNSLDWRDIANICKNSDPSLYWDIGDYKLLKLNVGYDAVVNSTTDDLVITDVNKFLISCGATSSGEYKVHQETYGEDFGVDTYSIETPEGRLCSLRYSHSGFYFDEFAQKTAVANITINSIQTIEFPITIADFNHDVVGNKQIYGKAKAGVTFIFGSPRTTFGDIKSGMISPQLLTQICPPFNTILNDNGYFYQPNHGISMYEGTPLNWENSYARDRLNILLDRTELANLVVPVKKSTSRYWNPSNKYASMFTTIDKMFLPSENEVWGEQRYMNITPNDSTVKGYAPTVEGTQYPIFAEQSKFFWSDELLDSTKDKARYYLRSASGEHTSKTEPDSDYGLSVYLEVQNKNPVAVNYTISRNTGQSYPGYYVPMFCM